MTAAPSQPDDQPPIRALACDFAGVLTNPLSAVYASFHQTSGISEHEIAVAMAQVHRDLGRHPLAELEKGLLTEADFLSLLGDALQRRDLSGFREAWFRGMRPNVPFIDYVAQLRENGYRLALLTNNVREWEQQWRQHLPPEELFEVTVNSAFVGTRKPEPEIYLHLLRLMDLAPAECLLVDDVWENCRAARNLGMPAVWFRSTVQARFDIGTALGHPLR